MSVKILSKSFQRLVAGLKNNGKTFTVVESCCGGLINTSIMAIEGSSRVFYGGSVAYNTKKAKKLLLDDEELHHKLCNPSTEGESGKGNEATAYIQSKKNWTAQTAIAFCDQLDVDYAIAEGGAAGPTFRPEGLDKGFAVISIAGRSHGDVDGTSNGKGKAQLLAQKVVYSSHADREKNMRYFADAAAELAIETIGIEQHNSSDDTQGAATANQHKDFKASNESPWLDRASKLRSDESVVKQLQQRNDAKYVVLRNTTECLFSSNQKLALLHREDIPAEAITKQTFLGIDNAGVPIFAVNLKDDDESSFLSPAGAKFVNTRTHGPMLSLPHEYDLVLHATAMEQWHQTHKFCSSCGGPLLPIHGGTCLQCSKCGISSWPRQDPSIIVLITNRSGDKALLARSPRHPPKVHTAIAGFVEAGEAYERAVMREVWEETGVKVDEDSIKYLSSQPWPFPRSTMIGFRATADENQQIEVDLDELVSASWFEKHSVLAAAKVKDAVMKHEVAKDVLQKNENLELLVPPRGVLARSLIDNWLEDTTHP